MDARKPSPYSCLFRAIRRPTLLCVVLLATVTARGDWTDELSTKPGNFPPLRAAKAHYKLGWSVVTAGEADFAFSRDNPGVARLDVTARSTGLARKAWRLDASHSATMRVATLQPLTLKQREQYNEQTITSKVSFTPQAVFRYRESKPADATPPRTKRFKVPHSLDLHSAIHFIRSQPLEKGETYKLAVFPADAPYLAQIKVIGRDKIRVAGKTWPAYQLDLKLWQIEKDLTLAAHDKFKRATIWLSADADRVFLKFETDLFIGTVWGELEKLEFR